MELVGYEKGTDFEFKADFDLEFQRVLVTFEFKGAIKRTDMIFKLLNKEMFQGLTGKVVANDNYTLDFPGNKVLPESVDGFLDALAAITKSSSRTSVSSSSAGLLTSSLFTNSMSFLGKLVQIVEFTGLMELFNIDFDQTMGEFLSQLNEATEFSFLGFYTNEITDTIQNSIATQWKGKLSKKGVNPYLLQDLGYLGVAMIVIFFIFPFLFLP